MLRLIVGAAIIIAGILAQSAWGILGIFLLVSGLTGWCGLYRLLGISTDKQ